MRQNISKIRTFDAILDLLKNVSGRVSYNFMQDFFERRTAPCTFKLVQKTSLVNQSSAQDEVLDSPLSMLKSAGSRDVTYICYGLELVAVTSLLQPLSRLVVSQQQQHNSDITLSSVLLSPH